MGPGTRIELHPGCLQHRGPFWNDGPTGLNIGWQKVELGPFTGSAPWNPVNIPGPFNPSNLEEIEFWMAQSRRTGNIWIDGLHFSHQPLDPRDPPPSADPALDYGVDWMRTHQFHVAGSTDNAPLDSEDVSTYTDIWNATGVDVVNSAAAHIINLWDQAGVPYVIWVTPGSKGGDGIFQAGELGVPVLPTRYAYDIAGEPKTWPEVDQVIRTAAALNKELANVGNMINQMRSTDVRLHLGDNAFYPQPTDTSDWTAGAGRDPYITGIDQQQTDDMDILADFSRISTARQHSCS